MRFVLVQCKGGEERWGIPQFRATCATEKKTIDVFFFAFDVDAAKRHVRARYPDAYFSDERRH